MTTTKAPVAIAPTEAKAEQRSPFWCDACGVIIPTCEHRTRTLEEDHGQRREAPVRISPSVSTMLVVGTMVVVTTWMVVSLVLVIDTPMVVNTTREIRTTVSTDGGGRPRLVRTWPTYSTPMERRLT